jgi:hypothetical protein
MDEEPPPNRLTAPRSLPSAAPQQYVSAIIAGLEMPFWELTKLFVKVWFAWLLATLICAFVLTAAFIAITEIPILIYDHYHPDSIFNSVHSRE